MKTFLRAVSLSVIAALPLISLAHGEIIDEHPHTEDNILQISPIVLVAGLALTVSISGVVWFFLRKKSPKSENARQKPSNKNYL